MPLAFARFWSKVDKNGPIVRIDLGPCWIWTGNRLRRPDGSLSYGRFGKRNILAHRFAWQTVHGELRGDQLLCHHCDNVACVRPEHLFIGTQADNLKDMRTKGRGHINNFPSGEKHPLSKITPEIAVEIRRLREGVTPLSLAKIGARFGLHASTVHDIVTGKTWKAN